MNGPTETPRVLCAPDKLRGALDGPAAARALAEGVRAAGGTAHELPVADGGEGTLDALLAAVGEGGARVHRVTVADALGRPRAARLGELPGGVFVVEAAEAVPLHGLSDAERDPARASSAGVGELIAAALDRGGRKLAIAVGGTATLDGGAGMLRALGANCPRDGGELLTSPVVDLTGLDARLRGVELELLSDVEAPLTGARGTARLFGPQKGADAAFVTALDAALERWAAALGVDPQAPGAGSAGGIGAALHALGARTRPGAAAVLDELRFDARLREQAIDLCLTAEGSVDASTLQGKAVAAVVERCARASVPVIVLGGRVDPAAAAELRARGAAAVLPLGPPDRPLPIALSAAAADLRAAAASAITAPR